jgi:hypothetical protein
MGHAFTVEPGIKLRLADHDPSRTDGLEKGGQRIGSKSWPKRSVSYKR